MKKAFFIFCLLNASFFTPLCGQERPDSVHITHTQETGTLEKQRFIDQYDYVFMTKEPVKHLLKGGMLFHSGDFFSTQFGFEKKIGESWSINLNTYFGSIIPRSKGYLFSVEVEPRFYFNMRNRIGRGQSANNLNGSYIGFCFQKPFLTTRDSLGVFAYRPLNTIGFSLGWQRRISNSFFADLSILAGFRYTQQAHCAGQDCGSITFSKARFTPFLMTSARVGVGSTFKRSQGPTPEMCILTKCYETINQLWKIDILQLIQLDRYYQSSNIGVEYERCIVPGWSINTGIRLRIENFEGIRSEKIDNKVYLQAINNHFITSVFTAETRYFPKIRNKQSTEQIENNLSGTFIYLGFNKEHTLSGETLYLKNPFRLHIGYGLQYKISQRGFFSMQYGIGPRIKDFSNIIDETRLRLITSQSHEKSIHSPLLDTIFCHSDDRRNLFRIRPK